MLTDIMSTELETQQQAILYYAYENYEDEIEEALEEFPLDEMPEEVDMVFRHYAALWKIFYDSMEEGTIIEEFLNSQAVKIKRPRVRQVVKSWSEGFPGLVRVDHQLSSIHYKVTDILTNKEYPLTLLKERPFKEQELLFGFFVPYESAYTIFTEVLDFEGEDAANSEQSILSLYDEVGEEDPEFFYQEWFLEILETLMFGSIDEALEELEWNHEQHRQVADTFKQKLREKGAPETLIRLGVTLWHAFCENQPPARTQKPMIYVAALHYLIDSFTFPEDVLIKKDYAEEYGVSVSSLSSKLKDLESGLGEELLSLREEINSEDLWEEIDDEDLFDDDFEFDDEEFDFSIPDEKLFLHDSKERLRQRAQDLIYEAIEERNSAKRKKLAEQALAIYQDCADAYVILGEHERDPKKRLALYEQGLQAGERDLGQEFFKESIGHFWGFHETRPYMRVKLNLALQLLENNQTNEAIAHLEELLELNPNDNQGVRYSLTQAYFKKGLFNKVSQLLDHYDLPDAHTAYSKVFIHYQEHGITKQLEKLVKEAQKSNPFVPAYVLKQKKLPKAQPDYIGMGDETEAVSYVLDFGEFWWGGRGANGLVGY